MGFTVAISNTKHLIKHHTFLKISLHHRKSHVVKLDHNSDAIIRFNLQDCHFNSLILIDATFISWEIPIQSLDVRSLASHKRTLFSSTLKTNKIFVIILQMLGIIR